ncbi:GMC family oxidoreductase N-terminal domain-containing protein [uncultured Roseibium sp.]|uniref:GMC family oxidoreductase n=1 Tax=uncultured Roseibium sp. TaxID=1936171 RepID=UPI002629D7B2|nr:GMC family oxidoreductase N-terminal domain-containing protein [uncultured Roseibium sp.]
MENVDYIIVGAGSAGCILAERLSADHETRVLLLEAGSADTSPWVRLPLGYGKLISSARHTWQFTTEPDDGLNGRSILWPRGRLLGGSGSINAMVYCRGLAADYDDWETSGAEGWSWRDAKPVFERLETKVSPAGKEHGEGPIHVQNTSEQVHGLNRHFFAALDEAGLPQTDDINGDRPEGGAVYHINTRRGERCSSARAFLRPAMTRTNLSVRTEVHVKRILFDGFSAAGVELSNGETITAANEIILSAGAVGSPQLLQVSGIGPGQLLQSLGVPVLLANDNVGGNLQDHLTASYTFRAREATLNTVLRPLAGQATAALQYAFSRTGPLALSVNQCGGFLRSRPGLNHPDQQLYFNPISYRMKAKGTSAKFAIDPFNGFIICAQPTRPTSRGRIDIKSADSTVSPTIQPNSLSTEEDRLAVVDGGRLCQKIMGSNAMRSVVEASVAPHLEALDDSQLLSDFRDRASTVYHPVSTCRMGEDRETTVTDSRLRVHGIKGLRVVDASAFPNITSGNTNAPTMMLALKGADLILQDRKRATS